MGQGSSQISSPELQLEQGGHGGQNAPHQDAHHQGGYGGQNAPRPHQYVQSADWDEGRKQNALRQLQKLRLRSLPVESARSLDEILANGLYTFVYPQPRGANCVLHGSCGTAVPTHSNEAIFLVLEWLRRYRVRENAQLDSWVVTPVFEYTSLELRDKPLDVQRRFKRHMRLATGNDAQRTAVVVLECSFCGDGSSDLFASPSTWGHRTLLVSGWCHGLLRAAHFDCLGDQGVAPEIAVTPLLLGKLLRPFGEVAAYPHGDDRPVYFQHRRDFMCQNWVILFADAVMRWSSAGVQWNRLASHYSTVEWTMLVFFHCFHLRRLLAAHRGALGVVVPVARRMMRFGLKKFMTLPSYGFEYGNIGESDFVRIFGATPRQAHNFFANNRLWRPEPGTLMFPPDNVPARADQPLLDPLTPLRAGGVSPPETP